MSDNPYESPETVANGGSPVVIRRSTVVWWLVGLGAILLLVALLLPTVRVAREPARRSQCASHLRQIALALHLYHDTYHSLPPAYTVDANGKRLHSWRTLLLPFNEGQNLYDRIDLTKPWDDPVNIAAGATKIPCYCCPSVDLPLGQTTYLAVVTPGGCFQPTQAAKFGEITDKTELTLLVVEVDAEHAVPWMSPHDADEDLIRGLVESRKLPHVSGIQAAMTDSHVILMRKGTKPEVLRALITIEGGDDELAEQAN